MEGRQGALFHQSRVRCSQHNFCVFQKWKFRFRRHSWNNPQCHQARILHAYRPPEAIVHVPRALWLCGDRNRFLGHDTGHDYT